MGVGRDREKERWEENGNLVKESEENEHVVRDRRDKKVQLLGRPRQGDGEAGRHY